LIQDVFNSSLMIAPDCDHLNSVGAHERLTKLIATCNELLSGKALCTKKARPLVRISGRLQNSPAILSLGLAKLRDEVREADG